MSDSAVRWREDTGFEFRCSYCRHQRFWPLTDEFWNVHRNMTRCRACWRSYDAQRARELRAKNPDLRAAGVEYMRRYRAEIAADLSPAVLEWRRAKSRETSRRYRERQKAKAA